MLINAKTETSYVGNIASNQASHLERIKLKGALQMQKTKLLGLGLASVALLASCGGSAAKEAKLIGSYISAAQLSYNNMRPTYNYYLTNYTFEVFDVYDDGSYCLTVSSSTFSALIIPETGNDAQGNERDNSLVKYYGTCTSEQDDLDPDTYVYTISSANRIVIASDGGYYVDTDNWSDSMKEKSADKVYEYDAESGSQKLVGTTEYATGADYLAAKNIVSTTLTVNAASYSLDYKVLEKVSAK